jgi:hypothetical protein
MVDRREGRLENPCSPSSFVVDGDRSDSGVRCGGRRGRLSVVRKRRTASLRSPRPSQDARATQTCGHLWRPADSCAAGGRASAQGLQRVQPLRRARAWPLLTVSTGVQGAHRDTAEGRAYGRFRIRRSCAVPRAYRGHEDAGPGRTWNILRRHRSGPWQRALFRCLHERGVVAHAPGFDHGRASGALG